jgi:hypothetical protein
LGSVTSNVHVVEPSFFYLTFWMDLRWMVWGSSLMGLIKTILSSC